MAIHFASLKSAALLLALLVPAFAAGRLHGAASGATDAAARVHGEVGAPTSAGVAERVPTITLPEIVVVADRVRTAPKSLPELLVVADRVREAPASRQLAQPPVHAVSAPTVTPCSDRASRRGDARATVCDVRTVTLAARDRWTVDAGTNGGIRVEAWDRPDAELRAVVEATAATETAARRLIEAVEIETAGTVQARAPRAERGASVSVSFEMRVPRQTRLDLAALNGGIHIEGVSGDLAFRTLNGGVALVGVGGDVRGETTNGGLHVDLAGPTWAGRGLDARTTNGAVRLRVPPGYDARLETATTNGALRLDLPGVAAAPRGSKRLATALGRGGPLLRLVTTNGAVSVAPR